MIHGQAKLAASGLGGWGYETFSLKRDPASINCSFMSRRLHFYMCLQAHVCGFAMEASSPTFAQPRYDAATLQAYSKCLACTLQAPQPCAPRTVRLRLQAAVTQQGRQQQQEQQQGQWARPASGPTAPVQAAA